MERSFTLFIPKEERVDDSKNEKWGGLFNNTHNTNHNSAKIYNYKMEKIHITPSNYHTIVNVPHKLPIVSMSPLKLPKNVNGPPKTNKKIKMTLNFFE
jgi:hypothetical protein